MRRVCMRPAAHYTDDAEAGKNEQDDSKGDSDENYQVSEPVVHELRNHVVEPGGSVRGKRANLKGLVLDCMEAKF